MLVVCDEGMVAVGVAAVPEPFASLLSPVVWGDRPSSPPHFGPGCCFWRTTSILVDMTEKVDVEVLTGAYKGSKLKENSEPEAKGKVTESCQNNQSSC